MVRWTMTGTDKRGYMGKPPTRERITVTGTKIICVLNGKIVKGWQHVDVLGMRQQLSLGPQPTRGANVGH